MESRASPYRAVLQPKVTKAPREGASFITSRSDLGGLSGGRGVGKIGEFFRLSPSWSWTKPSCQRGLFWARFRSFWVRGFLDVQRKNRPPLMLLMLVWACPLMLLLLLLAWVCRLHMSQHDCLSLSGKDFICWIKSALRDMLDQNCCCDAVLLLPPHYRQCVGLCGRVWKKWYLNCSTATT